MDDILEFPILSGRKPEPKPEEPHQISFSAQDILASIGFEAQRIAAAVGQHAAGAPFPDPNVVQQLIDRMSHLNKTLVKFSSVLSPSQADMHGQGGMGVNLDN